MRGLLIFSVVVLAIVAVLRFATTVGRQGAAIQESDGPRANDSSHGASNAPVAFTRSSQIRHGDSQRLLTNAEVFFDPELLRTGDIVHMAQVKKHMDLRHYYNSPARDTPECIKVLQLVLKEGGGTNAVPDAYNIAWDYAQAVKTAESAGQKNGPVYAQMLTQMAEDRFRRKHGITNAQFFEALRSIRPNVFFGVRDTSLPEPGESLLE